MSTTTPRLASVALALGFAFSPRAALAEDPQPPPQPQPPASPQGGYPPPAPYPPAPYPPAPYPPAPYPGQVPGGPKRMPYDGSSPVPYGYSKVTVKRKGLIIGGGVTLGATYGVSLFAAAIGEDLRREGEIDSDLSALWIPVAGPFIQAGQTESSVGTLYLMLLGAGQTAGAIMLFYGLTTDRTILVRNDYVVTPMLGDGAAGMTVTGRF